MRPSLGSRAARCRAVTLTFARGTLAAAGSAAYASPADGTAKAPIVGRTWPRAPHCMKAISSPPAGAGRMCEATATVTRGHGAASLTAEGRADPVTQKSKPGGAHQLTDLYQVKWLNMAFAVSKSRVDRFHAGTYHAAIRICLRTTVVRPTDEDESGIHQPYC
jgi:hypothetical protein